MRSQNCRSTEAVFRYVPKQRRPAYLWVAFFLLPGAGFVLSGAPGAAATVSRVLLAATVLHHSAFLIDTVVAAGLRRLLDRSG